MLFDNLMNLILFLITYILCIYTTGNSQLQYVFLIIDCILLQINGKTNNDKKYRRHYNEENGATKLNVAIE